MPSSRQKKAFRSLFFSLKSSATNDRDFEQIRGNMDKICRYSVDVQWSLVMKRVQNKKQLELCKQNYNRLIQFIALEKRVTNGIVICYLNCRISLITLKVVEMTGVIEAL